MSGGKQGLESKKKHKCGSHTPRTTYVHLAAYMHLAFYVCDRITEFWLSLYAIKDLKNSFLLSPHL